MSSSQSIQNNATNTVVGQIPITTTPIEPSTPAETCRKSIGDGELNISFKLVDSQLWTQNTKQQCIAYTDTITKTIPSRTLRDEFGVEIELPEVAASPSSPVAIVWYNQVYDGDWDHANSIPLFFEDSFGEIKVFQNIHVPRIDYDHDSEKVRLTFWTNASGDTIFLSTTASVGCEEDEDEVVTEGSIDPFEKSGGKTTSLISGKTETKSRALMQTEGEPIKIHYVDDEPLPISVVYKFNEPTIIYKKKGGISEYDLGTAAKTLICDNTNPDCATNNKSTIILDGECDKEGDLDDLTVVECWKAEKTPSETTTEVPRTKVTETGGGSVTLESATPPPKDWSTGSTDNIKRGKDSIPGDDRWIIWQNENKSAPNEKTIKGGLLIRDESTGKKPVTSSTGTASLVNKGEGDSTTEGTEGSSPGQKYGMLRDVMHITDDNHNEVRTSAHFAFNGQFQKNAVDDTKSGPILFVPSGPQVDCLPSHGVTRYLEWERLCRPFKGHLLFTNDPKTDTDPTDSCICAIGWTAVKYTEGKEPDSTIENIEGIVTEIDGGIRVQKDDGEFIDIHEDNILSQDPLKPHTRKIDATREFPRHGFWRPIVRAPIYLFHSPPYGPPDDENDEGDDEGRNRGRDGRDGRNGKDGRQRIEIIVRQVKQTILQEMQEGLCPQGPPITTGRLGEGRNPSGPSNSKTTSNVNISDNTFNEYKKSLITTNDPTIPFGNQDIQDILENGLITAPRMAAQEVTYYDVVLNNEITAANAPVSVEIFGFESGAGSATVSPSVAQYDLSLTNVATPTID